MGTAVTAQHALVIGGTGPTGPHVVKGLVERGYTVTILHGGHHEVDFDVAGIEHIHADPHFTETLEQGVDGRSFELVVAQYGRLRVIADYFAGRTERLVAVGGATAIFGGVADPRWGRLGKPAWFAETSPWLVDDPDRPGATKLGYRMVQALDTLFRHDADGVYSASCVLYPVNYGPRNPGPHDWAIVRRILDGRRRIVIADGGIKLESRVFSPNAAHAVLQVVDDPVRCAGQRYVVADAEVYTMRQRIEFIAAHLGAEVELVDLPYDLAWPCHPYWRHDRGHRLCQSTLIREQLGYREPTSVSDGLAATVDWLVANPPERGGEAEQQIGDPFDYAAEDALITSWTTHGAATAEAPPLPPPTHQYRHPKAPGEAWSAGPGTR